MVDQRDPRVPVYGRPDVVASMGGRPPYPGEIPSSDFSSNDDIGFLREENAKLKTELAKMTTAQGPVGMAIRINGKKALVALGSGVFNEVDVEGWDIRIGTALRFGRTKEGVVKIVATLPSPPGQGRVVKVEKVYGDIIEYTTSGDQRASRIGDFDKLRPGDKVLLDPLGEVVLRVLERHKAKGHTTPTGVSWDDIGGLEDTKTLLREAIEDPHTFKDLYRTMGQKAPKGMLLKGPPGVGKGMLAKACWSSLAKMHGHSSLSESGYIYVRGPELINKFYGESEAAVRLLFTSARQHFEDHHYPALIFLDEADGLLARRGSQRNEGMEKTIVPQFLAEMDGLDESCAFVLVATNRADMLDPGLLREGRLDEGVSVPRPDRVAAQSILRIHLRNRPCDIDALSKHGVDLIFSDKSIHRYLVLEDGSKVNFPLREVVSGAMLSGLVRRATQIALRRAKAGGKPWIMTEDIDTAMPGLLAKERLIAQEVEVLRFAQYLKLSVVKIEDPSGG